MIPKSRDPCPRVSLGDELLELSGELREVVIGGRFVLKPGMLEGLIRRVALAGIHQQEMLNQILGYR